MERFEQERSIISLEQRVKDQTSQVDLMEANAKRVPEIEAEEKGLVRDYNIIKERYDGLYKQNEDLKFTDVVDQRDDAMSYRIINEPVEPARPSGPNRLLLLTASLVGGLIVGLLSTLTSYLIGWLRSATLSLVGVSSRNVAAGQYVQSFPVMEKPGKLGMGSRKEVLQWLLEVKPRVK